MYFASRLDEIGRPAWLALMIVSFIVFWPVGLGILAFLIGSGRMACWKHERDSHRWGRWQEHMMRHAGGGGGGFGGGWNRGSGNRAFDEYRADTLRRLEEEEREFREFLDRLRFAKDKSEFDEFLSQRRQSATDVQPQA